MGNIISKGQDKRVYYSRSEVAKHNTPESLWIIANDKVYDITQFYRRQRHPGGIEPLLSRGGGAIDASSDMRFHSKRTKKLWNQYLIGYSKL